MSAENHVSTEAGSGKNLLPVALKYCGGCNPTYERSHIVRNIRRDLPDLIMEAWRPEGHYGYALLICGCFQSCLHFACDNAENGILEIHREEDYHAIYERLAAYAASAGAGQNGPQQAG